MSTDIQHPVPPNGAVSAGSPHERTGYRHLPPEHAFAAPAGLSWTHVDERLTPFRRAVVMCYAIPASLFAALVGAYLIGPPGLLLGVVLGGGAAAIAWVLADRDAHTWSYTEGADELIIKHGLVVRRLTVIPYGRIQFADVSETPLEKLFGLATLRMHTAAAAHSYIPGLPAEEAVRLRDRVARRVEQSSMGL